MPTTVPEWSVLEGKTLIHIEGPDGVPICSLPKKRRGNADLIAETPKTLNALFAWRSAVVHSAAITLGKREGDREAAQRAVCKAEAVMVEQIDKLHNMAVFPRA